ncbi:MAG TPA: hypothetical protein VGN32_03195, partial [Ktedonobacterales bacterium]|nr:hypothetical protein [Ktedonobacterales bacterium]
PPPADALAPPGGGAWGAVAVAASARTAPLPSSTSGVAVGARDAAAEAPEDEEAAPSPAAAAADTASTPVVAPEDPTKDPTIMPDRLERLIRLLGQRLGAEDGLLPAIPTVVVGLLMLLPFLGYAAVALGPRIPVRLPVWPIGAGHLSLAVLLVGIVLALAVGAPTAVIYRRRAERVSRVRRLLVLAYIRWWAEQCGRYEDRLRREGVARLTETVEQRLAAITAFEARLRAAASELSAEAARMDESLGYGPEGRRDIFVLGGSRFPTGRLRQFHQRVQARRGEDPLDARHASAAALGAALRQRLRALDVGLLDLESAQLAKQAATFGAEVCGPYLTGELVNVVPALHLGREDGDDEQRVPLSALLERATPLYRPITTDSPRRLVALAAPDDFTVKENVARHPELRLVVTPSPEWLLVAQLVSHGRPRWWRQALAPPLARALPRATSVAPVSGNGYHQRGGG